MLICYKDLFDYNVSNYNHLLTPRMTSQTDLCADPEEIIFFEGEEYYGYWDRDTNKEWKPDVGHFENVETYDHLRNGRRRGRADGEQSRSTSFSGFLTPSLILSCLFFSVWAPSVDYFLCSNASDWLEKKRWVIASFYKCLYIKVTFYKYIFAFTLRKFWVITIWMWHISIGWR